MRCTTTCDTPTSSGASGSTNGEQSVVAAYDAEAATYDRHPYPNRPQQAWVKRLLTLCPDHGIVLDAPCGTGRYFPLVAAAGHRVVGIDQSANMLAEAQRRGIAIDLQHVGLQELSLRRAIRRRDDHRRDGERRTRGLA